MLGKGGCYIKSNSLSTVMLLANLVLILYGGVGELVDIKSDECVPEKEK